MDTVKVVDLRTVTFDVPPQEVLKSIYILYFTFWVFRFLPRTVLQFVLMELCTFEYLIRQCP